MQQNLPAASANFAYRLGRKCHSFQVTLARASCNQLRIRHLHQCHLEALASNSDTVLSWRGNGLLFVTKQQRMLRTLFGVVAIGAMNAVRTATGNSLAFQQHPVASVVGSVIPAILLGIGYYWYTGTRMAQTTWKLSGTIPWIIGLLGVVALIALLAQVLDDSPEGLPKAAPRQSGNVNSSPQQPATPSQVVPTQSADANGSAEKPIRLPNDAISQCKCKGGPKGNGTFEVELYNGSAEWHISELTITIKAGDEARNFKLHPPEEDVVRIVDSSGSRLASRRTPLAPLSTGNLSGSIGSFLNGLKQGEWQFGVVEGAGYR